MKLTSLNVVLSFSEIKLIKVFEHKRVFFKNYNVWVEIDSGALGIPNIESRCSWLSSVNIRSKVRMIFNEVLSLTTSIW